MDFEKLRLLMRVVDNGSVQGAARLMGISRALLRRRLEALEDEIGTPLFHRSAAGVHLTAAGGVLLAQGRALLERGEGMLADARAAAGEATGLVRIVEPVGLPASLRAMALMAIHRARPGLRHVLSQVEDPLASAGESYDLIFHFGGPPDDATWYSRVLLRHAMHVVAAPSYIATHGTPRTLADLATHRFLGWRQPRRPSAEWPLRAGGHVTIAPWIESSDIVLLRRLAADGGGLLFAPLIPFPDEQGTGALVPVLEALVGEELAFRGSSRHPAAGDPRTRDVLVSIRQVLGGFPES